MRITREELEAGIASQREIESWRAERKERRWIEAHPYAVKELLDAMRRLKAATNALPAPPQGCDKKTKGILKRRINQLIAQSEVLKDALEKYVAE